MHNKEIRRANLLALVAEFGSAQALAEAAKIDATHLRNVINKQDDRELGDKLSRRIEEQLKKPLGWMDIPHEEAPASWKALIRVLEALPESKRPAVMEAITETLNPPHPEPAYASDKRQKIQPVDRRKKRRTR